MKNVNKIKLSDLRLKKGDKVLDVGCSSGIQAIEMARQGLKVYATDLSPELINLLKRRLKDRKLSCFPRVGDATKLPYNSRTFNALIATEVFEHIDRVETAVQEAYRVLLPGGRACIAIPTTVTEKVFRRIHPTYLENSGHQKLLTLKRLISFLKQAGFKIEKIERQNFEWSGFWLLHSLYRTRFDFTGSPLENLRISRVYNNLWDKLYRYKLAKYLLWLGNRVFPKSYYIYAVKEGD